MLAVSELMQAREAAQGPAGPGRGRHTSDSGHGLEKLRKGWQFAAAWVERQAGCSPALGLGRKAVAAPRTREGAAHVGCPSRLA